MYLDQEWDFAITLCSSADLIYPPSNGRVKSHLHKPFDDTGLAPGSEKRIMSEFRSVRDEMHQALSEFYHKALKSGL